MALDRVPTLGTNPVKLVLNIGPKERPNDLAGELRALYQAGQCCDVGLICSGQCIPAHSAVLAARSPVFREIFELPWAGDQGSTEATPASIPLKTSSGRRLREVRITEAANPEAVRFMIDYMYGVDQTEWKDYNPKTQDITVDVLRLAQHLVLPGLVQRATRWLAKDITTGDVVERLAICRKFELVELESKIIEQLCGNQQALAEVASDPKIMQFPELMLALLKHAAKTAEPVEEEESVDTEVATPSAKKRAKISILPKGKAKGKGSR